MTALDPLFAPLLSRWRLCALLVSAAMLAIAHGFQTFGGYQPCTLCLRQREVYWVAGGLALGFMSLRTRSIVLGVAIHMTVALSMDFAAMWQKGWL